MDKPRTLKENNSLHKYFTDVANSLMEHGVTVRDLLEKFKEEDVPPTGDNVKQIWKSILRRKHSKTSTTQMTHNELSSVLEDFYQKVGELTGENIEFPSEEVRRLIEHYSKNL